MLQRINEQLQLNHFPFFVEIKLRQGFRCLRLASSVPCSWGCWSVDITAYTFKVLILWKSVIMKLSLESYNRDPDAVVIWCEYLLTTI